MSEWHPISPDPHKAPRSVLLAKKTSFGTFRIRHGFYEPATADFRPYPQALGIALTPAEIERLAKFAGLNQPDRVETLTQALEECRSALLISQTVWDHSDLLAHIDELLEAPDA